MIKLSVDMEGKIIDIDLSGAQDKAIKEIVAATVALTDNFARLAKMSFESSAIALYQLSKELWEQAQEKETEADE